MPTYTPHTEAEIADMLAYLGIPSIDALFDAIPDALRLAGGLDIAPGAPEPDVMAHLEDLAAANKPVGRDLVCFAGGGAYDREVPAVTRALASRSEFVTSYTPYQAEVAQGVLQALFEYQTCVTRLTGLDVSNASLYDGASSLAEAVNLACDVTGRQEVWVSSGVNPAWREVLVTLSAGTGHRVELVPLVGGQSAWPPRANPSADSRLANDPATDDAGSPRSAPQPPPAALVVAYPNYLGCLEDLEAARKVARASGALLVVCFDPVLAGILRSVADWGADIAVAEGQALGIPLSFGGPYLGIIATRMEHVRRLPGRIVGTTTDAEGRRAFTTTLRAREQDIRREKASSNVCTNQTLLAVTAAIQMGWLGPSGLAEVAIRSARAAHYCMDQLLSIEGVEPLVGAPCLAEFALKVPIEAGLLVERLLEEGYLGGIALGPEYAPGGDGLLVACTERRTRAEIDAFSASFARAVK